MTAHTIQFEPSDLDRLHAERASATERLQRLDIFYDRRNAAEAKLAEIARALEAIDKAERQEVERWAAGTAPNAPEPLLDERRALLARRNEAEAERLSALAGANAVEPQRRAIVAELNSIKIRILETRVNIAVEAALALHAEGERIAKQIIVPLQEVEAIKQALIGAMNSASDSASQSMINGALSKIGDLKAPVVLADATTVAAHAQAWREKLR